MAGKLTEEQISELQEIFNLFDNRGDSMIYVHQLGEVLRASGLNPTEMEIRKCEKQDPDSRMKFEAFLPIYQSMFKNRDQTPASEFIEGFRVFDKEENGLIASAELRHLLSSLGERLSDEEVELLLQGMESDVQGNINYEEFVKMVLSG